MSSLDRRRRRIDFASALTLLITTALFFIAVFEKGLTHDLLLEAGVFLVSFKLVLASYQAKISTESIEKKLDQLAARMDFYRPNEKL